MGKMTGRLRFSALAGVAAAVVLAGVGAWVGAGAVATENPLHATKPAPMPVAAAAPLAQASGKEKKRKAPVIWKRKDKAVVRQAEDALFGGRYVALGSSFAAGPGLAPGKPAVPGAPARCGQSMANYPTLLAERLSLVLIDRSCSGAQTANILNSWGEIPPQIEAVTPDTRLVTLTIGGNDLNYVGNAFAASCRAQVAAASPALPGDKARVCPALFIPSEADYAANEDRLRQIVREIHRRAPSARVMFVQYLTLIPTADRMCAAVAMSPEDADVLRTIAARLSETILRTAAAEGAQVVQMNEASATHTPCDKVPWMNGSKFGQQATDGIGWHLNAAGMKATADGIAYWLTSPARRIFDPRFEPAPAQIAQPTPAPTSPAPGFGSAPVSAAGTASAVPAPKNR